jgi:transcriptional regulator with XRE-family HTH domain
MNATPLAVQIRTRRGELGLSKSEVARLAGVTQPAVTHWEAGAHPKLASINGIAVALQWPRDEVAMLAGYPPTSSTRNGDRENGARPALTDSSASAAREHRPAADAQAHRRKLVRIAARFVADTNPDATSAQVLAVAEQFERWIDGADVRG